MGLFRKKCEYCREKIENGKEVKRNVKVPGFVGTHPKTFCHEDHAKKYEQEIKSTSKHSGGKCCH